MSKIVFISPSVYGNSASKSGEPDIMHFLQGNKKALLPQLAPMVLAALTPSKHSFIYIDEEIEDIDFDKAGVDLVALTATTAQADRAYAIAGEFRKRGVTVVMGGVHATVLPDEASLHADAVCVGEGENIWPAMLEDFEAGALKPRYASKDYPSVTKLVSPRVDIVKHECYSMFPVMATKGCPNDCDFCSIRHTGGHRILMKPVEQVMAEIAELEQYNKSPLKKYYMFFDDNLYINRDYTMKLFTALKDMRIHWNGHGTLNTAKDDEVLDLMAGSGCRFFFIGFESISEASLKEVNKAKSNRVGEYEAAIMNLNRRGIIPAGYFIFGFDNDDKDVFKNTLDFMLSKHIMHPYIGIMTPFPGTRLYDRIKERITVEEWKYYTGLKTVFAPVKMTGDELDSGFLWINKEVRQITAVKRQLEYFWSQGPWPSNPRLRLWERAFLLLVALKLGQKKQYKQYKDFVLWAAAHRNASDLFTIIGLIVYIDMQGIKKQIPIRVNAGVQAGTLA